MGSAEIAVLAGGVGAIAVLVWYFFGSRTAHPATVRGGVQEATRHRPRHASPGSASFAVVDGPIRCVAP